MHGECPHSYFKVHVTKIIGYQLYLCFNANKQTPAASSERNRQNKRAKQAGEAGAGGAG